jgi:hypothetical protein
MLSARNPRPVWEARARVEAGDAPRVGRSGDVLVAEWPGFARLTCDLDGKRPVFSAVPGADPGKVSKLRDGAARALLADLRGGLSLHASAVAIGSRAILLVGPTGAGKSTAAGELCLRHGGRLLADDMASLDVQAHSIRVNPTERHHYLASPSLRLLGVNRLVPRSEKQTVRAARAARSSIPLALVVVLRPDGRRSHPAVRVLAGADVVRALLPAVVRFDVRAPRRRELDQIFTLYARCRVVEIARPVVAAPRSLIGDTVLETLQGAVS